MRGFRPILIALVIGAAGLAGSSSPAGLRVGHAVGELALAQRTLATDDDHRWASDGTLGKRWIGLQAGAADRLD